MFLTFNARQARAEHHGRQGTRDTPAAHKPNQPLLFLYTRYATAVLNDRVTTVTALRLKTLNRRVVVSSARRPCFQFHEPG